MGILTELLEVNSGLSAEFPLPDWNDTKRHKSVSYWVLGHSVCPGLAGGFCLLLLPTPDKLRGCSIHIKCLRLKEMGKAGVLPDLTVTQKV